MALKRATAIIAALVVVVVLAGGCSSSKTDGAGSSDTSVNDTSPTLPFGGTTNTTVSATSETTLPFTTDDQPIVRAPDLDAFCAAFGDVQTLVDTFSSLDFSNGLGLMAAPTQARAAARRIRETAPDEIVQPVDAYAVIIDQVGQSIARATSLRRLSDAVGPLASASSNPEVAPVFAFVVKKCVA